ncbi:adenylyltransferase/cytidyltransferase family protein [bacterium]|nr:adenylyltransferase/cytidyltransferase family protein [bacterium]
MKNTVKKIITFGVFDMFHFGHLRLFQNIKDTFGKDSFLIVCVQSTENILKYKPKTNVFYSTEDRVSMIKNLKCVDEVKIYDDIDKDIKEVEFDVWVKGPDQSHQGFQDAMKWCDEHNKQYVVLNRTEGISSTYLKNMINDLRNRKSSR